MRYRPRKAAKVKEIYPGVWPNSMKTLPEVLPRGNTGHRSLHVQKIAKKPFRIFSGSKHRMGRNNLEKNR